MVQVAFQDILILVPYILESSKAIVLEIGGNAVRIGLGGHADQGSKGVGGYLGISQRCIAS